MCIYIYRERDVFIYIYIKRERERERETIPTMRAWPARAPEMAGCREVQSMRAQPVRVAQRE